MTLQCVIIIELFNKHKFLEVLNYVNIYGKTC